jgi:hypothetical protein
MNGELLHCIINGVSGMIPTILQKIFPDGARRVYNGSGREKTDEAVRATEKEEIP